MNKGKLMNTLLRSWQSPIKSQALTKSSLRSSAITFLLIFSVLLLSSTIFSTAVLAQEQQEAQELLVSEAQLAQILAPIALYPDTLLTHILIASTYPIEVIQAERWLTKHLALTAAQLQKRAENKGWDASVVALLPFPRVMEQLSEDLNWMQTLGDAFLQDEARVLGSIQTLRQQAEQAGSLANMDNVQVIKEQQTIIIEPAQATVIYVPYYDSRVVYGRWHWSHYPPVYWHHPHHYASYNGHFYWGHGVHISTHFFFSAFHWHNRHIVVSHHNRYGYHPRKKIVVSHNAKRWHHQTKHRRGVAYSSGSVKKKYHRARPIVHSSHSTKNNKSIKYSTPARNKTVHSKARSTSVKGNSVKSSSVKATSTRNINRNKSTSSQVRPYKNAQSKQRVSNNKAGKPTTQSRSTKRQSVHKHPVSKPSPKQAVKVTRQHNGRHH